MLTNNDRLNILILLLVPYIYLFPHTFQFVEMGNDFELLYYSYKKYIFEFIRVGHFPLWSPSESLGYSLIFNPFAQYFYPLSWVLYLIGIIIGDLSKHTYLLYTIFGISIYNVGQYLWLKKLNIDTKYCIVATLITCFGLKLTEILRFPNAIHSFAWFSWMLYGMTLSIEKGKFIKSFLIILFSSILIFSAGYPYYILYGFILFSFYFLFISFGRVKLIIAEKYNIQSFYKIFLNNSIPPMIAFIIIFPWFEGIRDVMEITRDRNLNDINFSFTNSSNFIDQIGSWIFPPISIAESNYYFGSIISILLIYYFITFFLNKRKQELERYFVFFFIIFFLFIYQFSAAEDSYLFKIVWEKIDFIKNFRAFGRMNILLVPLFSVLICFAIKTIVEKKDNYKSNLILIIIAISILILQIYFIEFYEVVNEYWNQWQSRRLEQASNDLKIFSFLFKSYNNYIYSFFIVTSAFLIILFKKNFFHQLIPILILIFVIGELFILANIQWAIPYKYYDQNNYNKLDINPIESLNNSFNESRVITIVKGNTYYRNFKKFNVNYFDQFGIDAHTKLVDRYFDRKGQLNNSLDIYIKEKIKYFWSIDQYRDKVFFSKSLNYNNIEDFVDDVIKSKNIDFVKIQIDKKSYNGDQIIIFLDAKIEGYITFMDNWSPGWKVYINDEEKEINKLFNSYKSVKTSVGKYKIKFKYEPW